MYLTEKTETAQVPNLCPFKENILKEAELFRQKKEDERKKLRQDAKERRKASMANQTLEGLIASAERKQIVHNTNAAASVVVNNENDDDKNTVCNEDKSLKAYYKEFKKVLDAADVILEVVDARDPLGTRSKEVKKTGPSSCTPEFAKIKIT